MKREGSTRSDFFSQDSPANCLKSVPSRLAGLNRLLVRLPQWFDKLWERLGDLLFLEHCRICRRVCGSTDGNISGARRAVCPACWAQIADFRSSLQTVEIGGGSTIKVASGTLYLGNLKRLLYRLKYDKDRLIAFDLAQLLLRAWSLLADDVGDRNVVLVPVPLHKRRLSERGFNQTELLTRRLVKLLGVRSENRALLRVKETIAQHGLGKSERLSNLAYAFQADSRLLNARTIVLVDDVCTSGATLAEAARTVLSAGARKVVALTVARATIGGDH
jgi:ComF family protein